MKKSIHGVLLLLIMGFSLFTMGISLTWNYSTRIEIEDTNNPLKTQSTFGAWIIIGGDRWDHDKLPWIKYTTNETYEILISCGYDPDEIYYLFPDGDWAAECPYADNYTDKDGIEYAIEQWAATNVGAGEALGIYMMDHGGVDNFPIPGVDLTANELDTYIDNYEASSGNDQVIVIYDACHSGSFINELSQEDRIIVTSTSSALNAFGVPPFFWEAFWGAVKDCDTIGEAFEAGEQNVEALGYGGIQTPLIDDDHDGIGHETDGTGNLPNGGDGNDALNVKISRSILCYLHLIIEMIPLRIFLPYTAKYIPIFAEIQNKSNIEKVYVRIVPPNWQPVIPDPDNEGTMGADNGTYWYELEDPDGDGNYTGPYQDGKIAIPPNFTRGDYEVNIIAKGVNGSYAKVESTYWTVNDDGNPPEDITDPTIEIINPLTGSAISETINVTAEGDDDQALDKIEIYVDSVLKKTESMPEYYPYPQAIYSLDPSELGPGQHTITAKAIDKNNNSATHTISITVQTIPGFEITIVVIGCFLIILTASILKKRKNLIKLI
ncbi:MAG: hypothetical protein GF329_02265 [Candidatus Lokiarchaeota archaeon]|nr:hypothetical protein [Candidatus Lokiarchaeota archaeon]